ncbi:MAG: DUF4221 family protein [Bacteroidales bacterium]|nr:DUF4221 family protein [Bacteroidales bacterium]
MKKLLIFLNILLAGCSDQPKVYLVLDKEVSYTRENGVNDYFCCQCDNNIFIANPYHSKTIYVYDINGGENIRKIELPITTYVQGYHYESDSSVIFCPYHSTQILRHNNITGTLDTLVNLTIAELTRLRQSGNDLGPTVEFTCGPATPLIAKTPHYYIANVVFPYGNKKEQMPIIHFVITPDSTIVDNSVGRFPDSYYDEGKSMFPFNMTTTYTMNDKQEIVVSHLADHHLYIYKTDGNLISKECKSKYLKELPKGIEITALENENILAERDKLAAYVGIAFDSYRNIYYRFVKMPDKKAKTNNLFSFSIMILDTTFNVLGEQLYSNTPYNPINALVTPEGLLLKKNDDYSGASKFGLFKIKGL